MTTRKTVNDHAKQPPDLIVIVTTGDHLPAAHLTEHECTQVAADWCNFEHTFDRPFGQSWHVAIAHIRGGQLVTTGSMIIPRTAAPVAAAGAA